METPELNPEQIADESSKPQPQSEGAGAGGGRKTKTAIGTGDFYFGGGGNWFVPGQYDEPFLSREPLKNGHLKDMAISELSSATVKEWYVVYQRLIKRLSDQSFQVAGRAEVLATMTVTAYTLALYIPDQNILNELRIVCAYFSDAQLKQIIEIAQREKT
jgi:hypothetical protein